MNVQLPPEQHTFIEQLVASGRYSTSDEAISAGVRLLVSQEELKQKLDAGIEQAERGELLDHDTVFAQLRIMAAEIGQSADSRQ